MKTAMPCHIVVMNVGKQIKNSSNSPKRVQARSVTGGVEVPWSLQHSNSSLSSGQAPARSKVGYRDVLRQFHVVFVVAPCDLENFGLVCTPYTDVFVVIANVEKQTPYGQVWPETGQKWPRPEDEAKEFPQGRLGNHDI